MSKLQGELVADVIQSHAPRIVKDEEIEAIAEGYKLLQEALSTLAYVSEQLSSHAARTRDGVAAVNRAGERIEALARRAGLFLVGKEGPEDLAG